MLAFGKTQNPEAEVKPGGAVELTEAADRPEEDPGPGDDVPDNDLR
jgi:hypothetical protein